MKKSTYLKRRMQAKQIRRLRGRKARDKITTGENSSSMRITTRSPRAFLLCC
jgi:hypothetical protein